MLDFERKIMKNDKSSYAEKNSERLGKILRENLLKRKQQRQNREISVDLTTPEKSKSEKKVNE